VSTAATVKGLTFVFAYADGSGVQLNHVATGFTVHASDTTAGVGTNALTTAPGSYTNNLPGVSSDFAENLCLTSDLLLTGTTDTSSLDATITAYSDGYKAKISVALDFIMPGAGGGWAGVCLVYYSTEYVQNNTNGSVCFAAGVDSATGAGPRDFGAGYLMEVTSSTWKPPAQSASLTPSSGELSGTKYGIVKVPPPPTPASRVTGRTTTPEPIACRELVQLPTLKPPPDRANSLGPSRSPPAFSHSEQPFLLRCD